MKRNIHIVRALITALALIAVCGIRPVLADAVGGPLAGDKVIEPHATHVYHIAYYGDELAEVLANGDGDIDIYVYDEDGDLVTEDRDPDSTPLCMWTPPYLQTYTIKVVNCKGYTVHYHMETN